MKSSEWYYAHRDYALQRDRANRMRREYGLSVAEHVRLELEQDHACAICRRPFELGRAPHVDHDHATGKVRGLLCGSCNRAIGLMSESIARLTAAAAYLAEKKP